MPGTFTCSVVTPEQRVFEGDVSYIVLPAWDGEMGFAVHRAPVLVKVGQGNLKLTEAGGKKTSLKISGGFAQMKGQQLTVLTDRAESAAEVA
ncbi:MAG: F0F1 ATP synthase subunit epsilon [Planctomycetota bacterium]